MAFGLSAALRRALSAIHASCSRVVPYSWKWRCANIAIQIAADGDENTRFHSMKPLALKLPPPPPPGITAERPFSPSPEPSYTLRTPNPSFATPDATAGHAL